MKQRMAICLLLVTSLAACGGAGTSLPATVKSSSTAAQTAPFKGTSSIGVASTVSYSYTAPWGGFGAPGAIYVLGQGACNDIPATLGSGFTWPAFLTKLAQGTKITIYGVPSYNDAWSKTHDCPTGGIVASNVIVGSAPTPSPVPSASPAATSIEINSGGSASGSWLADTNFSGGINHSSAAPINLGSVPTPAPMSVYQSYRYGKSFSYEISRLQTLAPYTVRLHFAENFWAKSGARVFNVAINGTNVLSNFDVYQAARGENIAVVKQFNAMSDNQGNVRLAFDATVDNALISGIEIIAGVVSATPRPEPSVSPSPSPTPMPTATPAGSYHLWSSYFTGKTPFHETVAYLKSHGAKQLPQIVSDNLWRQGAPSYNLGGGGGGIYRGASSDPAYTFSCLFYSSKGCNAHGKLVHIPDGAIVQQSSDHHVIDSDGVLGGEVDGWGGGNGSNPSTDCSINYGGNSAVNCSWGGFYPFSGNGLDNNSGSSATNAGFAFGIFVINAAELLNGHIDHALALNVECLDNPAVYPADTNKGTDGACSAGSSDGGSIQPAYGDLWVLNMTPAQISATSYSGPCKTILNAFATYGAYTTDTWNGGIGLEIENGSTYGSTGNPWFNTIYPQMAAAGDGSNSRSSFNWHSCLNRLSARDWSIYQIANQS